VAVKKVFIARHPTEAYLVKSLLKLEGVESEIRGEALFGALGELAITADALPSVWIVEDHQLARAEEIVSRYVRGLGSPDIIGLVWRCRKCGETLEPQFTTCWKCGTDRR
jgi:hypothetical protein